jgi:Raf kinase inhibitor-like YbhB/YbcL family protein
MDGVGRHPMRATGPRTALKGPAALLAALLAAAAAPAAAGGEGDRMNLTSEAFASGGEIPARHTCDADDTSPPLAWGDLPPGTRSLALIVDDPDAPDPRAPKRVWVHWVLHDLPPDTSGLPAGVAPEALPAGTRQGANDWGHAGYDGPCPPIGRHRYFFKLYALDAVLGDLGLPTKTDLLSAMDGHVLAHTELMGTYARGGR